jgi:ATP-dependent Lon protease
MTMVIIPYANAPELSEIPDHVRAKLTIKPVRDMTEVLNLALLRPLRKMKPSSTPRVPAGASGSKSRGISRRGTA